MDLKTALMFFLVVTMCASFSWAQDSRGFAVVELFTSEGCSSCPPADELGLELAARAQRDRLPICVLGFHVDYWNYLGWDDVFSQKAFSVRQRDYGRVLEKDVYTPQAIVNGRDVFVGSDRRKLNGAIEEALKRESDARLDLKISKKDKVYELEFHVDNVRAKDLLRVAIVEDGLSSDVTAGENAGKTLAHANVVRWFQSVAVDQMNQVEIPVFPDEWKVDQLSVIAYVQDPETFEIKAAAQIRVQNLPLMN